LRAENWFAITLHTPLGSWYQATKHALEGWSDCLRVELAPFGIDVVIIEPGAIESDFADVMLEPMMKRSGNSPYSEMARQVGKMWQKVAKNGSPRSAISNVVSEAVRSSRPKTRYVAGKYAKSLLFMRRWLSDRLFDRLITSFEG